MYDKKSPFRRLIDSVTDIIFGKELNEIGRRYDKLRQLDCGDMWREFREGRVTLGDIRWYAGMQVRLGNHDNAQYHFERLRECELSATRDGQIKS